ncbi:MAG: TMEM175 family protein [Thermoplasmata archaeon]
MGGEYSGITPERIQELSGFIFGLALSISALQLALSPPRYEADFVSYAVEFSVSFVLLIGIWLSYLRVTRHLRREETSMLVVNLALLMLATIEPYFLFVLWTGTFDNGTTANVLDIASVAWALDIGLMFLFLAWMTAQARRRSGVPGADRPWRDLAGLRTGIGCAMLATAVPFFWTLRYETGIVTDPVAGFPIVLHLRVLAWLPILAAAGVGSIVLGRRLDRALGDPEDPPAPEEGTGGGR